jgi:hypothetical protein
MPSEQSTTCDAKSVRAAAIMRALVPTDVAPTDVAPTNRSTPVVTPRSMLKTVSWFGVREAFAAAFATRNARGR